MLVHVMVVSLAFRLPLAHLRLSQGKSLPATRDMLLHLMVFYI